MSAWLRRLAVPRARYCCGQLMTWCTWRAAWVCGTCANRR